MRITRSNTGSSWPHIPASFLAVVAVVFGAACSDAPADSSLTGNNSTTGGGKTSTSNGAGDGGTKGGTCTIHCGNTDGGASGGDQNGDGQNGGDPSGGSTGTDAGTGGNPGSTATSALPAHALIGYWHDFANPSGPAFPLSQVSNDWDVIDIAFASSASPSGSMAFTLDPSLDETQFKADVAAKRAAGKKVVLSLGGQDGTVSLSSSSDVDNFVTSLTGILKTYGFDGLDIDLETGAGIIGGAPIQTNLVTGIKRIKAATLGSAFYLSMAPEHPYVQGAQVANAGIWGSYLPIIDGLRDDLTVLHVQLYNDGDMPTPWGTYHPTSEDLLVGSVDMLLAGFQPASGAFFNALRPDQVAFGLPSGASSANPGNFATVATIEAAYSCITAGTSCASHTPSKTYPSFRGVMSWSINWDAHDGASAFSQPLATFLHAQR